MAHVQTLSDLTNIEDVNDFMRFGSATIGAIVDTVNGNLEFEKNIRAQIFEKTLSSVVGEEFSVQHDLNKTDVNFLVVYKDATVDVYKGSSGNTLDTAYFKATAASVKIRLLVF